MMPLPLYLNSTQNSPGSVDSEVKGGTDIAKCSIAENCRSAKCTVKHIT